MALKGDKLAVSEIISNMAAIRSRSTAALIDDTIKRMIWRLQVYGYQPEWVQQRSEPISLDYSVRIIVVGKKMPDSVGYDDLGNPCVEYPKPNFNPQSKMETALHFSKDGYK